MTLIYCDPVELIRHQTILKLSSDNPIRTYEIENEFVFLPFAPCLYNRRKRRQEQYRGIIGMCRIDVNAFNQLQEDYTEELEGLPDWKHCAATQKNALEYVWYINGPVDFDTDLVDIEADDYIALRNNLRTNCRQNWRVANPNKIFRRKTINIMMRQFLMTHLSASDF